MNREETLIAEFFASATDAARRGEPRLPLKWRSCGLRREAAVPAAAPADPSFPASEQCDCQPYATAESCGSRDVLADIEAISQLVQRLCPDAEVNVDRVLQALNAGGAGPAVPAVPAVEPPLPEGRVEKPGEGSPNCMVRQRLQDAQSIAHLGNWYWEPATDYVWWSDELYRMFGVEPGQLVPSYDMFLSLVHPADIPLVVGSVEAVLAGANKSEYDARIITPDGSVRWIHSMARPTRGPDGELLKLEGTDQDITERKLAEEHLRERERLFSSVFNQQFQYMVILDRHGLVREINELASQGHGISPQELSGKPVWECPPWRQLRSSRELWEHRLRQAAEFPKPFVTEDSLTTIEGEHYYEISATTAVRNPAGEIDFVIAEARDVTEARLLREELYRAQRLEAVGRLANGVVHDFNNLLAIVRGQCDLCLHVPREPAAVEESLQAIRAAAQRGAALVKQLSRFSQRDATSQAEIDLNASIRGMEVLLEGMVQGKVRLEFDLEPDPLWVAIDPTHLEQVLFNLVANACDASPRGEVVTVRTRHVTEPGLELPETFQDKLWAELSVADAGPGFDAQLATKIFEPYFTTKRPQGVHRESAQVSQRAAVGRVPTEAAPGSRRRIDGVPSTQEGHSAHTGRADFVRAESDAYGGMGLGLAIVHDIVEHSGGIVQGISRRPRGALFRILLPQACR
jgi:PAS domain S-box-containing protein